MTNAVRPRLGIGLGVVALHIGLVWGMLPALVQTRLPSPSSVVVRVKLLPEKHEVALPAPHIPRFTREPAIVAIPPQVTIARSADMIRATESPKAKAPPSIAPMVAPPPLDYLSRLAAHLNSYKSYPYEARIHRQEGTVRLRFTLDRGGQVLSYNVSGSSGSIALDDEAREMMRRANPFPPLPGEFRGQTLELEVPVIFSLH